MATYTKSLLSGSVSGKQIRINNTSGAGATTIHTAVAGSASWDEIWLYAYNSDTVTRIVTLLWGGITEPDNSVKISIPAQQGRVLIADGVLLNGGLVVKAYADATNVVMIDGFVNNIA